MKEYWSEEAFIIGALVALESWEYVDFRRIENAADAIVEWSNN